MAQRRRSQFPPLDESKIVSSRPAALAMPKGGTAEDDLAARIAMLGLPAPERQYRYVPGRRFAADFAWPELRLLLEVEGGVWASQVEGEAGAHGRGAGVIRDMQRANLAALNGWYVLRVTPGDVTDGSATALIEEFIARRESTP